MSIIALIEKKISDGKEILLNLSSMRETSGMAINVVYYLSEDVDEAIRKINKWQLTVKDVLINGFGESHRYVASFAGTITKKDSGFNFRREFEHEMNEGLSVLEGISESLKLGLVGDGKREDVKETGQKPPMVFISHAEADKKFANEIVTLLEYIGVKGNENLLCSSVDGYRIPLGCDIIEYLRETFIKKNLFVIILHTHNYYTRPVCMNEMGAAWALKTKYFSVLAPDFGFGDMKGVVDDKDVAIKIGADDCETRVNQLKNEIVDFFNLPNPNEDRWPYYRKMFISNCSKLKSCNSESQKQLNVEKGESQTTSLVALSRTFRLFKEGNGSYPFQIDVKFASQEDDVYFKTITLSNKKRGVEIMGRSVENDIMKFVCYIKPNILDIGKVRKIEYRAMVGEKYKSSIYVEDHKLAKKALETMSFHGIITPKRQMDGYDDLPLEDWELHVTYNVNGELMIPMNAIMLK